MFLNVSNSDILLIPNKDDTNELLTGHYCASLRLPDDISKKLVTFQSANPQKRDTLIGYIRLQSHLDRGVLYYNKKTIISLFVCFEKILSIPMAGKNVEFQVEEKDARLCEAYESTRKSNRNKANSNKVTEMRRIGFVHHTLHYWGASTTQ
ncbi:hypothetical protein RFI_29484, partial [Reticulomyxa filosa]